MNPKPPLFLPLVAREHLSRIDAFSSDADFRWRRLSFAEDLARLAALALDNARLHYNAAREFARRDEMVGVSPMI